MEEKHKKKNLREERLLEQNNETKATKAMVKSVREQGITLIALVITIIIMLILAGITLNAALGENGLIERAKKAAATYKKAEEDESKGVEQLIEEMDKVNGGNGETDPSPEPTETTEPTPETTPSPDPTPTPQVSVEDLNGKVNNGEADSVLGKEVTGLTQAEGLSETYKWQMFDVDETHIWLIAKDYIKIDDCPQKDGSSVIKDSTHEYFGALTNVKSKYTGAVNVSKDLRPLNKKFFNKVPSSTNNNAQVMAYLLDKDIWTSKFIGEASTAKVDYVIGCPTIEQIVTVNNKKHPNEKLYLKIDSNNIGYQISKSSSGSWTASLSSALKPTDSELVITNNSKSNWMWVASPSVNGTDYVVRVGYDCLVDYCYYYHTYGFRPVVALKSDVLLEESNGGYTIK